MEKTEKLFLSASRILVKKVFSRNLKPRLGVKKLETISSFGLWGDSEHTQEGRDGDIGTFLSYLSKFGGTSRVDNRVKSSLRWGLGSDQGSDMILKAKWRTRVLIGALERYVCHKKEVLSVYNKVLKSRRAGLRCPALLSAHYGQRTKRQTTISIPYIFCYNLIVYIQRGGVI
jgi:hypothetical protein